MAKVDEWRRKVDEWKGVLNQPKNAGLKVGGTGISEALRKVGDAEMDFEKAKEPGKELVTALNDLLAALGDAMALCKKTTDKHRTVFTTACKFLDDVSAAANTRRSEAAREVDAARKAVGDMCGEHLAHLKAAKDINEFATQWHKFAQDFELHAKGYPTLKAHIAKVKEQKAPAGTLEHVRPDYLKLVQGCETATAIR